MGSEMCIRDRMLLMMLVMMLLMMVIFPVVGEVFIKASLTSRGHLTHLDMIITQPYIHSDGFNDDYDDNGDDNDDHMVEQFTSDDDGRTKTAFLSN